MATAISSDQAKATRPAFAEPLHVGRPNLGPRDALLSRINDLYDRRWLTNNGPLVEEFESRVAALAQVKHCVATCNATVALELAIRGCGLRGEVIVPSFTFVATAHSLQWQEITPVFCDLDPRTHCIDPGRIEQLITPKTTGIIGVHVWGRPCAVDALQTIADRRGLSLLFDAAHAFGCTSRGRPVGGFGRAEVFSFHATKFVNSCEGGAVVTNDDELAERLRLMRNFGFAGEDRVVYLGTNGKMPEVCAAMGLTSLEAMDHFLAANAANYRAYRDGLCDVPGIRLLEYDESERCNFQYIVLEVDEATAGLSRDDLREHLHSHNVLARRYFWPGCHRMEPYKSLYPNSHLWLANTEQVSSTVLVLPTGTAVTPEMAGTICGIIREAVSDAHRRRPSADLSRSYPR